MIELDRIRIDGGTQARVELDQAVVDDYAEAYRSGVQMPPVQLFYDGATWWLADGFHRYFGAKKAGLLKIAETIEPGTQRDAVLFSLRANASHGLRRSNADKRKAVETLLADAEWANWSDRKIAEACGVGAPLVGDVRRAICNPITDAPVVRTVERGGKTYEQDTTKIGKRAAAGCSPATPQAAATASSPAAAGTTPASAPAQAGTDPASAPGQAVEQSASAPAAGPAAHVAELETQIAVLTAQLGELHAMLEETLADNTTMAKVFEADDQLQAATAEVKRLNAEVAVLRSRVDGLMNEKNEAIRAAKTAQRKVERLEKAAKS